MSYKLFLLEKELGYQITGDMSAVMVMERMTMLDRYWLEQKQAYDDSGKKSKAKNRLIK